MCEGGWERRRKGRAGLRGEGGREVAQDREEERKGGAGDHIQVGSHLSRVFSSSFYKMSITESRKDWCWPGR